MRRTTAAAIGTVVGTTLLLGAKFAAGAATPTQIVAGEPAEQDAGQPALAPDPGDADGDDADAGSGATAGPTTKPTKRTKKPRATPKPTASKRTTAPARPGSGLADGTYNGAASSNKYGTIRVTIVVSGGRMTKVNATYPTTPSTTGRINAEAIPLLKQQALAAQNARIATISGATYTRDSFVESLASALAKAKA